MTKLSFYTTDWPWFKIEIKPLDLFFWNWVGAQQNLPRHDKTNKVTVRPAMTQISLGIRPVWSDSSLCTQWVAKDSRFLHADCEDSDQTGRMPRQIHFVGFVMSRLMCSQLPKEDSYHPAHQCSPIGIFAGRSIGSQRIIAYSSRERDLWSDCANSHAVLFSCAHKSFCRSCCALAAEGYLYILTDHKLKCTLTC